MDIYIYIHIYISIYIDGNGLSVRSDAETEWERARQMAREACRARLLDSREL